MLVKHMALKFNKFNRTLEDTESLIVIEEIVSVYIDGDLYASFRCLPSQLKELVVGNLLTEGIIEDLRSIVDLKANDERKIYVKLSEKEAIKSFKEERTITFCGGGAIQPSLLRKADKLRYNKVRFNSKVIFKAVDVLNMNSSIYRASRGSHSAALINGERNLVSFAEDIGRHNAVDKVVGNAALKGVDFTKLLLALTGRLTSEIVAKAARVEIPVLVSLAAPTSLGIKMANKLGLTLIGFARKTHFNVYTFPERIEW